MARLDRLVTAKGIAQLAAVIGRQFSYELLQAVSQLDASTLQRELGRLVEAEIVYQRGLLPQAAYTFKHALIQDAAYQSLLKSTRQQYHQRIGQVLEGQFPETVDQQPELLAHHYTEAGLNEQAVRYWHKAGQRASARSAHVEAISHLRQGLALLQTLPATRERSQRALPLHIALGASLIGTKGYADPEVGQTYLRARDLCHALEDPQQLVPVLRGLQNYYAAHAEHQRAQALCEQLLTLAQQAQDPAMLLVAYHSLGTVLFEQGAVATAHTYLVQGIALDDPQQPRVSALLYGQDAGVACLSWAAWTFWYLGYSDQGRMRLQEALARAEQMAHPFSLVYALTSAAVFHQLRREVRAAHERAEATLRLAMEQGFPHWKERAVVLRGWTLAHQGEAKEGMAQLTQGLSTFRATGAESNRSYFLALLAEAHGTLGEPEAGLAVLTEALTFAETTGERWYEAELYRLQGALLVQQSSDNPTEAETCFHHAMAIAQNQSAKSWELRAATSLSKLWQQQGKRQAAHDLLAPVYDWFTEGFDTADLKDAKALLEELEEGR